VDRILVERGERSHAATQNRLAEHVRLLGIRPRSPRADEPNFDIAWQVGQRAFVVEVKSLTNKNEEKLLRLGLGQVLRYAQRLSDDRETMPVLVTERRPTDGTWRLHRLGVLAWPDLFNERLADPGAAQQGSTAVTRPA
jgi:hypothetical protein